MFDVDDEDDKSRAVHSLELSLECKKKCVIIRL